MKDKKNMILIIVGIILIIITIIAIYWSNKIEQNKPHIPPKPVIPVKNIAIRVKNYNTFYSIQNTINSNYDDITKSYLVKEIYFKKSNENKKIFYYINGYLVTNSIDGINNSMEIENYLLIVENNNYELILLENNIDNLEKYANEYKKDNYIVNYKGLMQNITTNISEVLTTYIAYFQLLTVYKPNEAYNMLTSETKAKYNNYDDFYNNRHDIYNKISTNIFSYRVDKENNKNYEIIDVKQRRIKIYENNIMDFKISY